METVPETIPPPRERSPALATASAPAPASKKRKSAAMSTNTRQPLQRIKGWSRPSRSRASIPGDGLRRRNIMSPDSGNDARLSRDRDDGHRRESVVRFRSEKTGIIHSTGSEVSTTILTVEPLSPPMTPHAVTSGSADALENELMGMDMRSFLTAAPESLHEPFDTSPGQSYYRHPSVESDEDSGLETVVGDTGLATVPERVRAPSPPPARPGPARPRRQRQVPPPYQEFGHEHHARRDVRQPFLTHAATPAHTAPLPHQHHQSVSLPSSSTLQREPIMAFPHVSNTVIAHLRNRLSVLEDHLDQVAAHIAHEQHRRSTLQEPDFLPQLYARREDLLWRAEGVFVRYADVVRGVKALREAGEESGLDGREVGDHGWMSSLVNMLGLQGNDGKTSPTRQGIRIRLQPQHCLLAALALSFITSKVWRVGIVLVVVVVVYGGPRVRPFVPAGWERVKNGVKACVASTKIGWNDVSKLKLARSDVGIR